MDQARTNLISRIRPPTIAAFAVFISLASKTLERRLEDPDLWWHLLTGRIILETGRLPAGDPYSFRALGNNWIPHEWGSELILRGIEVTFGLRGIIVLRTVLLVIFYALAARLLYRHSGNRMLTWVVLAIAAYAGSVHWSERPNLFSFLLFVTVLSLILRKDRWIWLSVPIAAVWSNLHGMFLLGLGLVTLVAILEGLKVWLHWGGSDRTWARRLRLVALASIGASMLNPFGPGLHAYSFRLLATALPDIQEWASTDFHTIPGLLFLILNLLTIAGLALGPKRPDPTDLGLGLAFMALGLIAVRNLTVASIVLALLCTKYLPTAIKSAFERRPPPKSTEVTPLFAGILNVLSVAVLLIAFIPPVITHFPRSDSVADTVGRDYPVDALEFIQDKPIRLFSHEYWSGLALYMKWPGIGVALDGRIDFYGGDVVQEFIELLSGQEGTEGTKEWLEDNCITHVLIDERVGLDGFMREIDEWQLVREDQLASSDAKLYEPVKAPGHCP